MLNQSEFATHIADTVREPLIVLDEERRVLGANPAFFTMFELSPDTTIGTVLHDLGGGEWDLPALRTLLDGVLAESRGFERFEVDHVFARTGRRVMWLNAREIAKPIGEGRAILLAIEDITDRRVAEEALAQRTRDLERSNRELEQFAAIASHDLQEPLRKIRTYADMLQRRSAAVLDDTSSDYVERMVSAATRMQTLIGDLLALARVVSAPRPLALVDLDRLVKEVLADMEIAVRESHGTVDVAGLPTISGDPLQMRQLFQNLISNAIKFRRQDIPLVITIAATDELVPDHGLHHAITVRDNGIGFDPQYAHIIFEPFQRLHGRGHYTGSGIGLAIASRIVERHGGSITASSMPGEGTTMTIRLPQPGAPVPPNRQPAGA